MSWSARRHLVAVAIMLTSALYPTAVATAAPCWRPPVSAPVSDPFRPPVCRWCSGNRGIEYDTPPGMVVTAVATGRVTFAGTVAGTGYVVVRHADGLRATYGNVSRNQLRLGDLVIGGMRLGSTAGTFHFGLRDGDRYIDPAPMIGRWVHSPRLIPSDGAAPTRARPPRLSCKR